MPNIPPVPWGELLVVDSCIPVEMSAPGCLEQSYDRGLLGSLAAHSFTDLLVACLAALRCRVRGTTYIVYAVTVTNGESWFLSRLLQRCFLSTALITR